MNPLNTDKRQTLSYKLNLGLRTLVILCTVYCLSVYAMIVCYALRLKWKLLQVNIFFYHHEQCLLLKVVFSQTSVSDICHYLKEHKSPSLQIIFAHRQVICQARGQFDRTKSLSGRTKIQISMKKLNFREIDLHCIDRFGHISIFLIGVQMALIQTV